MQDQFAREYLPFLPGWTLWVMYPIVLVLFAGLFVGFRRRLRAYRASPGDVRAALTREGLRRAVGDSLLQRKVVQRAYPAAIHLGIFYGVLLLAAGTTLVFLDEDILRHVGSGQLMSGWFYGLWEFLLDAAGLALVIGVVFAFVRRLALRPAFLVARRETLLLLSGLMFLALSGFLLEAYRLNVRGVGEGGVAFVGAALAAVLPDFDGVGADVTAYQVLWWTHFAVAIGMLAAVAYTGLSHILTVPLSLAVQDPTRPRARLVTPFNLMELAESEEDVDVVSGAASTEDLSPSERLIADACVACGRCHAECPAVASGRVLSPRDLVLEIQGAVRHGSVTEAESLEGPVWACTNCYACEEACPAGIRHVDYVLDFRRALVDQNRLDQQKLAALDGLDRNQNPYKLPSYDRAAWLADMPESESWMLPDGGKKEWLYWLGCSAGYDSRVSEVAQAAIGLFQEAGLSFGLLGPSEPCCGEPAKRLGEEGRFQMLAFENMELLRESGADAIVTHCPHCMNVLRYEYGALGFDMPVVHHTSLLARLKREGRLSVGDVPRGVVYHDPCNLARAEADAHTADVDVLLGPSVQRPVRSGARTFCCGGGGANMWYSVEPEEVRISGLRTEALLDTGGTSIATSCPFCLTMLTDAVGSEQRNGSATVRDVAEILADATLPDRAGDERV